MNFLILKLYRYKLITHYKTSPPLPTTPPPLSDRFCGTPSKMITDILQHLPAKFGACTRFVTISVIFDSNRSYNHSTRVVYGNRLLNIAIKYRKIPIISPSKNKLSRKQAPQISDAKIIAIKLGTFAIYCVITFNPCGRPIGSVKIYKDLYGY